MMKQEAYIVKGVFSYNIDDVWHLVAPFLNLAIQYSDGKLNLRQLHDQLIKKSMQLWLVVNKKNEIKACAVTEIIDYPSKRVLMIVFAAGVDVYEWIDQISTIKNFALYHDCNSIEVIGRDGWKKVLREYGYQKTHAIFRLELGRPDYEKDLDEISFHLQQKDEKI